MANDNDNTPLPVVRSPLVSVVMSVYNGERYLREAIESILTQTFADFEFIIIDDGSTDASRDIILSYGDSRIRLVDNERNLGLTRSLNRGLQLARGEYVARQDADDVSMPERLARQVAFLDTNPHIVLLGTWAQEIDAEGRALVTREPPCECAAIRWMLLFDNPYIHTSVILRRATVLKEVGFYNEKYAYAQDYDLWSRIARVFPVANLPEQLVKFRISRESMSYTYGEMILSEPAEISLRNLSKVLYLAQSSSRPGNPLPDTSSEELLALRSLCTGKADRHAKTLLMEAGWLLVKLLGRFRQQYTLQSEEWKTFARWLGARFFATAFRIRKHEPLWAVWLLIVALRLDRRLLFGLLRRGAGKFMRSLGYPAPASGYGPGI